MDAHDVAAALTEGVKEVEVEAAAATVHLPYVNSSSRVVAIEGADADFVMNLMTPTMRLLMKITTGCGLMQVSME